MKIYAKKIVRGMGISLCFLAASVLFVWLEGVQFSLALLTGTLKDPHCDLNLYLPEQNCFGVSHCSSGRIRVLTYNVLCRICIKEEHDPWDVRIAHLRALVDRYAPDLIGTQELGGWKDIREFIAEDGPYACVTFEFGPWAYADAALFYRHDRYEMLDSGYYWLSPKPYLPFAFAWLKLSAPRYVCWARLQDKGNGFQFLFVNTHMDNNGLNKETAAPIVRQVFGGYAKHIPVIFTGDFNTPPTTRRYLELLGREVSGERFDNAADLVAVREIALPEPENGTTNSTADFHAFEHMIDHVFLAGPLEKQVHRWIVDQNTYAPLFRAASDHPAVYTEIELRFPYAQ